MLTTQKDLRDIIDHDAKPLLITHHVQVDFYKKHGVTPDNQETANRIVSLAQEFVDAKLRVFVTELNTNDSQEPWGIACYGGVNPELKALGLHSSAYYKAKASDYAGHKISEHSVIVMTGFNTSLCILESIEAIRSSFPDVTIVVPKDAVANNFIGKAQSNNLSHKDALAQMEELGCIITDTESVNSAVKGLARKPAPV